ncbi:MAG: hypothetical protein JSW00_13015 [Thermoplasmata archaeon]|nr:MAG: hypothetical protein JSW00_13015 [Thermoplasmata archaeon]
MKQSQEPIDTDDILKKLEASFLVIYLTIVSIIQASVLGYLMIICSSNVDNINLLTIILLITTFLVIVTVWHEYMMGAIAFFWIPRLRDSTLPFIIGISEFLIVYNIFTHPFIWFYSLAVFCIVGLIAFFNMFSSAEKCNKNDIILKRVNVLKNFTMLLCLTYALFFILFGIILQFINSSIYMQFIAGSFSILAFGIFLFRGILYWQKIVDAPVGKQKKKSNKKQ